jgi:hypothetical protein
MSRWVRPDAAAAIMSMATRLMQRAILAALMAFAATAIVMAPLHVKWNGWWFSLAVQSAAADDGKGNGGGNGKGGRNGKGADSGEKGDGDNGGGKGRGGSNGGKGKGGDNEASTSGDKEAVSSADRHGVQNPASHDRGVIRGRGIEVLHRNGMRESVKGGRYLMMDGQGRTIIERAATKADLRRLQHLSG